MRNRSILWSAIAIAVVSVAISYLKFSRCIPGGWLTPDVYLRGCYSDITALYDVRGFASDIWPYGSGKNSLEYPILSGIGIWLISLISPNGSKGLLIFFHVNVIALALTYLMILYQLYRLDRRKLFLFAISPGVISALFINWDLWAIAPLLLSLVYLRQERYRGSGIFLALSIFLKFFPIIFLIPIVIALNLRSRKGREFIQGFIGTSLIINLPVIITDFDGWSKFYIFNFKRGVDFGSIWYLYSLRYSWINEINWLITPLVLALLIVCYFRYRDNLLGNIFLVAAIFFTLNKVYSPQYVLWLTVLALLYFPTTRMFYLLFVLWQSSEFLYQYGIWRHLLTVLNEQGGISSGTYLAISASRILTLLALAGYAIYLLENDLIKGRSSEANV